MRYFCCGYFLHKDGWIAVNFDINEFNNLKPIKDLANGVTVDKSWPVRNKLIKHQISLKQPTVVFSILPS